MEVPVNLTKNESSPVNLTKYIPKLSLRFKCFGLKDMDTFSKSDPQLFVYQLKSNNSSNSGKQLIGSTERIDNNLNPVFQKAIQIEYKFESTQQLNFLVLDIDSGDKHDTIGDFTTTLANIVSQPGKKLVGELKSNGKKTGRIEIIAEEIQETNHCVVLKLIGTKLDKKDLFTSDPYYKIFKSSENGNILVYQSPVIRNTLNPVYNPIYLKLEDLNNGDMNKQLTIEFWDEDIVGSHDFIGAFNTTTDEILRGQIREFPLINPKKQTKSNYKNSGTICFSEARLSAPPSFLDYISGCEINLMVAIDCTGSNGDPKHPDSLHYNTPTHESEYAKSILNVGNVLAPYDNDGKIEVLGFGANLMKGTSHCFQFGSKAEAKGVEGVLEMYNKVMPTIELSGPTHFSEIIKYAAKKSTKGVSQKNQKYTILLIITDGEICDMRETISEIVAASSKPLSIVIVGVGSASFDNMNKLDGDEETLCDHNHTHAQRDIVQFVPFRDYSDNLEALQAHTLSEIPTQLLGYMTSQNYFPNSRI